MIKEFIKWRNERRKQLALRAGQQEYLINTFADTVAFMKLAQLVANENDVIITMSTIDGITVTIKKNNENGVHYNKRPSFTGDEL